MSCCGGKATFAPQQGLTLRSKTNFAPAPVARSHNWAKLNTGVSLRLDRTWGQRQPELNQDRSIFGLKLPIEPAREIKEDFGCDLFGTLDLSLAVVGDIYGHGVLVVGAAMEVACSGAKLVDYSRPEQSGRRESPAL